MFGLRVTEDDSMLPCPFCKEKGEIVHVYFEDDTVMYVPQCQTFGCCTFQHRYETIEDAITAWNMRKE